jgi:hypothetical protein
MSEPNLYVSPEEFDALLRGDHDMDDPVNHPSHYQLEIDGRDVQAIDVIRAVVGDEGFVGYCHGSALKYLCRAGRKVDNAMAQDLRKAAWFLTAAACDLEAAEELGREPKKPRDKITRDQAIDIWNQDRLQDALDIVREINEGKR